MNRSRAERSSKWISMKWYIISIKITVIFSDAREISLSLTYKFLLFSVLFVEKIISVTIYPRFLKYYMTLKSNFFNEIQHAARNVM